MYSFFGCVQFNLDTVTRIFPLFVLADSKETVQHAINSTLADKYPDAKNVQIILTQVEDTEMLKHIRAYYQRH